jgi:hypothetical protein
LSGLTAYEKTYKVNDKTEPFAFSSQWVIVPLNPKNGATFVKKGWKPIDPAGITPWTDQRSSLLSAVRPFLKAP